MEFIGEGSAGAKSTVGNAPMHGRHAAVAACKRLGERVMASSLKRPLNWRNKAGMGAIPEHRSSNDVVRKTLGLPERQQAKAIFV